ncbi:MAG TPA: HEAT repeat domain-containing protein, partial [Ktedonobacteraceae bacterium]|nr:HEAT repeat domain-containing protein [Ktedonobacteraceae bacterium]
SKRKRATPAQDALSTGQAVADVAPPIGTTPPRVLARDAADGRRGAAWRLLVWVIENDVRAVEAVSSLDDDRLAQNLLEFMALGTWAGKSFVIPVPLRTAYARTRLRTLFLPGSGMEYARANRVLLAHIHDSQPAMRETTMNILGIIGDPSATGVLIEALRDPVPAVRLQAAKALGRVGDPAAVPALMGALRGADEQLSSQIFSSLVKLGGMAVPALLQKSKSNTAWIRWNSIRALSEIHDLRVLPALVEALQDNDHSVAWMGAKGLAHYGKLAMQPVLKMLMTSQMTPWLAETASYVLRNYAQRDADAKPILEPVVLRMREAGFRVGTAVAAQKALDQLRDGGLLA